MPKVLDWRKIDPARDFRFGTPKAGRSGHGGFSVKVEVIDPDTGRQQPFIHQAPPLSLPFGCSTKEAAHGTRHMAVLSFPTVRRDPTSGEYHGEGDTLEYMKFIQGIDIYNKQKAYDQCKSWFRKEQSEAVIDEFYFHNLYVGEKAMTGEFSPTFTTKIPFYRDEFQTKFFRHENDGTNTVIKFSDISSGQRKVIPLLETTGLWFAGKQFGMSFRLLQLMVFVEDKFEGCVIMTDPSEDSGYSPVIERPLQIELPGDDKHEKGNKRVATSVPSFVPLPTRVKLETESSTE
jgi:hypothetical protein